MNRNVIVLGSGFSSLSAACYLAKKGYSVKIIEKNNHVGGRARQYKYLGFVFDMGPTFYWMPDVFDCFFSDFGHRTEDFYQINRLDPAYKVIFPNNQNVTIPANFDSIKKVFDKIEPDSSTKLDSFINNAKSNYDIAIRNLVYKPGESILEIIQINTMSKLFLFIDNIKSSVERKFKDSRLRQILEFPVLFLGAKPEEIPAFYNFMNYADFGLGTWYPEGGMYAVVNALHNLCERFGIEIISGEEIVELSVSDSKISTLTSASGKMYQADIVVSGADYHHTESLLPKDKRQYSEKYWDKRILAPSALLFYMGFDCKIPEIEHHTLFFDADFEDHARDIYDNKKYPDNPLFYASFPSKTDKSAAPDGKESAIILIPLAPGMEDNEEIRKNYLEIVLNRIEKATNIDIKNKLLFYKSFSISNFVKDYNSYKGNAYGLANTLLQTHILKPRMKSNKIKNLYFTGQLTVPGPGVPPSLISGKLVSNLVAKYHPL